LAYLWSKTSLLDRFANYDFYPVRTYPIIFRF
jgi:hypothetical protein